ncbi:MAG: phospholipase D-like domain-containing protein [Tepidisphaeraceae bacterium]
MTTANAPCPTPPAAGKRLKHCKPPEHGHRQGEIGTSTGVNISPGSDDDGWVVPQPVTLADGTRVQLYKDGEALHAAFEAINNAKRRICLEVYIFADDETGRAFAELLCQKASQGVKVYVIYDSFGSFGITQLWRPKPAIFEKMRRSGVRLAEFHPMRPWEGRFGWRPVNRDHRKLLLIDDEMAGLGGLNVGGEYAGSWVVRSSSQHCDLWRDNAVGIVGPAARVLAQSFIKSWKYLQNGGTVRRAELWHPLGDSDDLGILASVPSVHSPLQERLGQLLNNARSSIELTMAYFAPPDELIEGLCKAARRGVRVRIMLPGKCDVQLLITAARSFYEVLLPAGVEIYERQHVILHAKTMCIDGEYTIVGSTNLDYRSIEYNLELSALIRSKEFGGQMHDLFENDVKYAQRVTAKEWRRRPWLDRFGQWAVKRARYLL